MWLQPDVKLTDVNDLPLLHDNDKGTETAAQIQKQIDGCMIRTDPPSLVDSENLQTSDAGNLDLKCHCDRARAVERLNQTV